MNFISCSKQITFAIAILVAAATTQADTLTIGKGQTLTLTTDKILVERLDMEDDSRLLIQSKTFELHALAAKFGRNVEIVSVGAPGMNSQSNGANSTKQADYGTTGANGGDGASGSAGAPGGKITMNVGLEALGSLRIYSTGGKGGNGSNGGTGQTGGAAKGDFTCDGGNGGKGGRGGNGGPGGNGGDVAFNYWNMLDSDTIKVLKATPSGESLLAKFTVGLEIINDGGQPGSAGIPGAGGAGGSGRKKNVLGAIFRRKAGNSGATGGAGVVMLAGNVGNKTIAPIPKP